MKTFFQLREETSGKTMKVSKAIFESARQMMNEQQDKAVTAHIRKSDRDAGHLSTHGSQHVYMGGQSDRENHSYHVHDTSTGKTHHVSLEHGGEEMSHSEVKSVVKTQTSGKVSPAATKAIHSDHSEEMSFGSGDDY